MARPKKCTADYFPHYVTGNSRTVFILEQRYGNDGYALWFKLLELLATTDGHYIDFNDQTDLEFFAAKTKINSDKTIEIIEQLAKLNAIDKELWEHKIIWSQNFVNNLGELYARRKISLPQKPSLDKFMYVETPTSESLCTTETPKVKESKVEKSRVKERREEESKGENDLRTKKELPFSSPEILSLKEYYENKFSLLKHENVMDIKYYLEQGMEPELIIFAADSCISKGKRSASYALGFCNNWLVEGILSIDDYKQSVKNNSFANNDTDDFKALLQRGPAE